MPGTRIADRIRFTLERLFMRGAHYQLLAVAALIGLISVVGGALVAAGPDGFRDLGDAIWWAFLRLSDPGYLGDDEGAVRRTISTALTVLGYVVFLGALVAIMTQWLNRTMRRLESGLTPVVRNDHLLILGWTNRTGSIVRELLLSEGRVRRFLRRHRARGLHIVILAEEVGPRLVQQLQDLVGARWNPRQVTLRSGTPLRIDDLGRVDFLHASAILIPASDILASGPEHADSRTVKTLLSLTRYAQDHGGASELPFAVAEILDARKAPVARRAYAGRAEILASDGIVARLLVQAVRHPGLSAVYNDLFTHGAGSEIYVRGADGFAGHRVDELADKFEKGVLLGLVRESDDRFEPFLNPPPDLVVTERDRFVVLAPSYEEAEPSPRDRTGVPGPSPSGRPPEHRAQRRKLLIIGWSRKVVALLAELDSYRTEAFEVDVMSMIPVARRLSLLSRRGRLERVRVGHIDADGTSPSDLADVDPGAYDHIILMGSDWLESGSESDARTIVARLLLEDVLAAAARPPRLAIELLDPENLTLLRERTADVIVSPVILSHMLAQVALRRELRVVFDELFGAGGTEIFFRSATELGLAGVDADFQEIRRRAAAAGAIALGVRLHTGDSRVPVPDLNPERSSRWAMTEKDDVVILATYARTEGES